MFFVVVGKAQLLLLAGAFDAHVTTATLVSHLRRVSAPSFN